MLLKRTNVPSNIMGYWQQQQQQIVIVSLLILIMMGKTKVECQGLVVPADPVLGRCAQNRLLGSIAMDCIQVVASGSAGSTATNINESPCCQDLRRLDEAIRSRDIDPTIVPDNDTLCECLTRALKQAQRPINIDLLKQLPTICATDVLNQLPCLSSSSP